MDARVLVVAGLVVLGCKREEPPRVEANPAAEKPAAVAVLPVTSSSPQAIALFREGRDLTENYRYDEAAAKFREALAKDPQFVQARAYLGLVTWPTGYDDLQNAIGSATQLPESERTVIEMLRATTIGDEQGEGKALKRLLQLAPDDARVHTWYGDHLRQHGRAAEAIASYRRAVELDATAAGALNGLGYAYIDDERFDEAIDAFRRYAAARPKEPNALDSLGDAQLMSGRYAEAEDSFRKALEVSPDFLLAWHGIAVSRAMRGDFTGARDALARQALGAQRPVDRVTAKWNSAWTYLTEKRHAEAFDDLAAAQKEAQENELRPTDATTAAIHAFGLLDQGKPRDALKQLEIAHRRLDAAIGRAAPASVQQIRAYVRRLETNAWSRIGDATRASEIVDALEDALDGIEPTPAEKNHLAQARGFAALARGDAYAAAAEFEKCPKWAFTCLAQLVLAREKAGDTAGAKAARDAFLRRGYRTLEYPYVRARVLGIAPTAATTATAPTP